MQELIEIIERLENRIEVLEKLIDLKELVIPVDGKLVVDNRPTEPTGQNGRIFYDTTTDELKAYVNGAWVVLA
jgi:hypothetical protein